MGLFKRFSDIISANINDLVDRMEDPEKGLRQAIREMEDSIQTATSETAKVLANQKRLEKELSRNEAEADACNLRAEECVDAGDDDGARDALTKAAEYEKLNASVKEQLTAATGASDVLKEQLAGMTSKLEEAKRSLATLSARKKAADIRRQAIEATNNAGDVVLEQAAFDKFDRLREKVEMAEAEAEAMAELTGAGTATASAERETNADIESKLAALKAKRSGS